jgi:hypothetical protein
MFFRLQHRSVRRAEPSVRHCQRGFTTTRASHKSLEKRTIPPRDCMNTPPEDDDDDENEASCEHCMALGPARPRFGVANLGTLKNPALCEDDEAIREPRPTKSSFVVSLT